MPKVAAIQLKSDGDLSVNLARAQAVMAAAAAAGAELLVLPEHFAYYGSSDLTAVARGERSVDSPVRHFLAEQARGLGVWIIGGTLPLFTDTDESKPYAASLLLDPQGIEVARYQKIHLFDVMVAETGRRYCESDGYQHGSEPLVVSTPLGHLGFSACYALRFPELYRVLTARGAEILLAPSAFTATTGKAHWRLLLQARAVENLCYVIGANLGNRDHPTKPTWGGSAIIDPWGDVLAEMADEEGFIVADVDLQRVADLRRNMPVLQHRRI
jgi:nitrilase